MPFVPIFYGAVMKADEPRQNRIPFMMSDAELEGVDEWRFSNRVATRADAIRRLLHVGLVSAATVEKIEIHAQQATHEVLEGLQKFSAELKSRPSADIEFVKATGDALLAAMRSLGSISAKLAALSDVCHGAGAISDVDALAKYALAMQAHIVDIDETIRNAIE